MGLALSGMSGLVAGAGLLALCGLWLEGVRLAGRRLRAGQASELLGQPFARQPAGTGQWRALAVCRWPAPPGIGPTKTATLDASALAQ